MSLEKEIHQKEFKNDYQRAIINIIYTHNCLVDKMSMVFEEFDLTLQQYNVLRILKGQYPKACSINLIKERMMNKMSDASRIAERLQQKGLIARSTCNHDKRATDVNITIKGLQLLEKMEHRVDQFEVFLHNLTASEVRQLNTLLDKSRMPVLDRVVIQK